jgi:cation diffusion facilitator CzcD-associated flavoprotein CzcO
MHSAVWDQDYDYTGKRVALIGNGSTALQILPAIRESCAHVVNYIRRPTWISANYAAQHTRDGSNFKCRFYIAMYPKGIPGVDPE